MILLITKQNCIHCARSRILLQDHNYVEIDRNFVSSEAGGRAADVIPSLLDRGCSWTMPRANLAQPLEGLCVHH